ncbi:MAG TPA: amino acid ABC transporter ATP-binding protein [Candidatus Acidoferrales bacterium]|nr:amino acid ABC transporter ATP-binding protein [Candidatus Acidoferrales bacterium]
MTSDAAVVTVRGLRTRLGATEVLRGIDFTVPRGEVIAVVGPSGGGKTTLLRALNYLTPFTDGEVEIAGHRLQPGMNERTHATALRNVRTRVGMVFQSFHLFPHFTALGNVMEAPRRVLGLDPERARARAQALLARVGLASHADAFPQTLSGGQQQRVAIARALAMEPAALLLDEPTSALDPRLVGEVLAVIADLAAAGQTMMIVTHEMNFARRVAHRVFVLDGGRIVESGPPHEVLDRPSTAATRTLLGMDVPNEDRISQRGDAEPQRRKCDL